MWYYSFEWSPLTLFLLFGNAWKSFKMSCEKCHPSTIRQYITADFWYFRFSWEELMVKWGTKCVESTSCPLEVPFFCLKMFQYIISWIMSKYNIVTIKLPLPHKIPEIQNSAVSQFRNFGWLSFKLAFDWTTAGKWEWKQKVIELKLLPVLKQF